MRDRFTVTLAVRCALGLSALLLALCLVPQLQTIIHHSEQNTSSPYLWILTGLCVLGSLISLLAIAIVPSPNDKLYKDAVEKESRSQRLSEEASRKNAEAAQLKSQAEAMQASFQQQQASLTLQRDKLQREQREFQTQQRDQLHELEQREVVVKSTQAQLQTLKAAMEEQQRKLLSTQAIADSAKERAQQEAKEILDSVDDVKRNNERLLREADERMRAVQSEEASLLNLRGELQAISNAQSQKKGELDQQAAMILEQTQQAAADRAAAETALRQAQEISNQAQRMQMETTQAQMRIQSLRMRCWPGWIDELQLEPDLNSLEELTLGGNSNAAMVLAYLQLFQAIESHPDTSREFNYLWPTVREIGRFLAALGHELPDGKSAGSDRLMAWGKALNRASKGRFTISVPTIGANFNPAQMESKSGPVSSVSRINNWAVSNAKSIVASKAEVT